MTVYIEARTEPHSRYREDYAHQAGLGEQRALAVRRPTRGIQLKEETFAAIRIMGPNGHFLPVIDAAGETFVEDTGEQTTTYWTNFFVNRVSEERHEKTQVVSTFGEEYIFVFGEAPRMLKVEGILLNTGDFNWEAEFWENYDRYFRGTRLVELGARLYLIYDDVIAEGLMVAASGMKSADSHLVPFSFQMYLTGYTNISRIGAPQFPSPVGDDLDYTQLGSYDRALQIWHSSRNVFSYQSTAAIQTYGDLGLLADTLRQGVISGGDPSIASFVSRARSAVSLLGGVVPGFGGYMDPARNVPIRGMFRDNEDEFVGPGASSKDYDVGVGMDQSWLRMDQGVDDLMAGAIYGSDGTAFDGCGSEAYWDMMGRAGRANQEIVSRGGLRLASSSRSSMYTGSASSRPPMRVRDVPFGMVAIPGGGLL